jgi:hypothetical protein
MPSSLLEKIDTSRIDPLIVERVRTMTGATPEQVTEGWCMDEWAGHYAMLEMMEFSDSLFRSLNSAKDVNGVLAIRKKFREGLTQDEIDAVCHFLLVDRFCLRKLYALIGKENRNN